METDIVLSPGETLKEELLARNIKFKDFAILLEIPQSNLSEIFKDKRKITIQLAFKLKQLLDISVRYWLKLQMEYDIHQFKKQ